MRNQVKKYSTFLDGQARTFHHWNKNKLVWHGNFLSKLLVAFVVEQAYQRGSCQTLKKMKCKNMKCNQELIKKFNNCQKEEPFCLTSFVIANGKMMLYILIEFVVVWFYYEDFFHSWFIFYHSP